MLYIVKATWSYLKRPFIFLTGRVRLEEVKVDPCHSFLNLSKCWLPDLFHLWWEVCLEHGWFFEKLGNIKKEVLKKSNFIIMLGIHLFRGGFIQLLTLPF